MANLKGKRHDADVPQCGNSNAIQRGTTVDPSIGTHLVFISHRGLQMKRGFANHLYHDLDGKGIHAFLDMEEHPQGDDVRSNMLDAARRAIIGVPIFTRKYTESPWCLKELAEMMKSREKVIPLFYDVKPEELRKEEGPFAKAIKTHRDEGRHDEETIRQWESALEKALWLGGFRLETYNQCEGELLKDLSAKIVEEVQKRVPVDASPDAVGLEKRVCDVVQLLRLENKEAIYFDLLWGMAGIGKTTLARDIYHRCRKEFDAASFVVKSEDEKSIQDCLHCDLLHAKNKTVVRDDTAKGKAVLQLGLRKKVVLIVLDGMKNLSSIEKAIDPTSLHPGSRILVTSQDQGVFPHLNSFNNVFRGELYKLLPLGVHESLRLLCWHAFKKPSPESGFGKLAMKVVKACDGLPLSLEVLGHYLSRMKKKKQWQEVIKRLQSSMFKDIRGKLMISYEDLNEDEREMFLDVACFLIGERLSSVKYFWHGIHDTWNSDLQRLTDLCLVKVDKKKHCYQYNDHYYYYDDDDDVNVVDDDDDDDDDADVKCLTMHDLLRDFGRSIAARDEFKKTGKWSRLWDDTDLLGVLRTKQGLDQIRGISTSLPNLNASFLSQMQSLQLLFFNETHLDDDTEGLKPEIRYWLKCTESDLEVLSRHSLKELDTGFSATTKLASSLWQLERLRILRLALLEKLLEEFGCLESLEVLDIGCTFIIELLSSFGQLKRLRMLHMAGCSQLEKLPEDFGCLDSLEELDIRQTSIAKLPSSFGQLKRLRELHMARCSELGKLPEEFGCLESLEALDIDRTSITELPSSFGHLKRLKKLHMARCSELGKLPEEFGCLESLEVLDIDCTSIAELLSSFGRLKRLRKLHMALCYRIEKLPEEFGCLESLEELDIMKTPITELPSSFGQLKRLRKLHMGGYNLLEKLPEELGCLESLEELVIDSAGITELPFSFGQLKRLRMLHMKWCFRLKKLRGEFGCLESLQELDIDGTRITERLSSFGQLKRLRKLHMASCYQIEKLPEEFGCLEILEELDITWTPITELPSSFGQLKRLGKLHMGGYNLLEKLPEEFGCLESLEELVIDSARITELLSSFGQLKRLRMFRMAWCFWLNKLLEEFGWFESLEELYIESTCIMKLPSSFGQLKRLRNFIMFRRDWLY